MYSLYGNVLILYARMIAKFVSYFHDTILYYKLFSKSRYLQEDCLTLLFLLEGCKFTIHASSIIILLMVKSRLECILKCSVSFRVSLHSQHCRRCVCAGGWVRHCPVSL